MNENESLVADLAVYTTVDTDEERPRGRRAVFRLYASARRQVAKLDQRTQQEQIRAGLASYVFALLDPSAKRWQAGVMLCVAPQRFRRKLSLPVFATDDEAMRAAETWKYELEKPR